MKRQAERIILSNNQMWDCNFPGIVAAGITGRAGGTDHIPKCSCVMITCLLALVPSGLALPNQASFCTHYFWTCPCPSLKI